VIPKFTFWRQFVRIDELWRQKSQISKNIFRRLNMVIDLISVFDTNLFFLIWCLKVKKIQFYYFFIKYEQTKKFRVKIRRFGSILAALLATNIDLKTSFNINWDKKINFMSTVCWIFFVEWILFWGWGNCGCWWWWTGAAGVEAGLL
jgi:hypothetical protein